MNNAILIDPETRMISKIDDFQSNLNYLYQKIGCQYVQCVHLAGLPDGNSLDLVIDEEARLRNDLEGAFRIGSLDIMNRAIVCIGNENTGEWEALPPELTDRIMMLLSEQIQFCPAAELDEPKMTVISF